MPHVFFITLKVFFALGFEEEAVENVDQHRAPHGAQPFQLKKEKSTAILLAIIITFLACHLLRFIVQLYEVFSSPLHGAQKLFQVHFFLHFFEYLF